MSYTDDAYTSAEILLCATSQVRKQADVVQGVVDAIASATLVQAAPPLGDAREGGAFDPRSDECREMSPGTI